MDVYNFNKLVAQNNDRNEDGDQFQKIDDIKDQEYVNLGEPKEDSSLIF